MNAARNRSLITRLEQLSTHINDFLYRFKFSRNHSVILRGRLNEIDELIDHLQTQLVTESKREEISRYINEVYNEPAIYLAHSSRFNRM